MKEIENGSEKIQKIAEAIRKETLDPAKEKAKEIIENAHIEAGEIVKKAHNEKERILKEAKKQTEKDKKVFDSSLNIACKQAFEDLKQKIETELFSKNLEEIIKKESVDPKVIANIINVIIKVIEKEGLDVDLSAYIPKEVEASKVNSFLLNEIINKLKEKEVVISEFEGGVKIKLHEKKITIDISDEALKNLIGDYIRADFRSKIFNI